VTAVREREFDTWETLLRDQGRLDELEQARARRAEQRAAAAARRMAEDNAWHVNHAARGRRDRQVVILAWLAAVATVWISLETAREIMLIPFTVVAVAAVFVFAWRSGGRVQAEEDHAERCPRQGRWTA